MKYTVCAETGSCSMDGKRWEGPTCGHLHRTYAAAEKCQAKLQNYRGVGSNRTCSAKWYNSQIHNELGERAGCMD